MRKLLIIIILTAISFAFMQTSHIPNITVNSVILAQGDELILSASNLTEGSYSLVLNSPSGQEIKQDLDTTDGQLDYALNLDESGKWTVNLAGGGLDTSMQVSVIPLANSDTVAGTVTNTDTNTNSINEAIKTTNDAPEAQTSDSSETSISTSTSTQAKNSTNTLAEPAPSLSNIIKQSLANTESPASDTTASQEAEANDSEIASTEEIATEAVNTTNETPETNPETNTEAISTETTELAVPETAKPTEILPNTQTENVEAKNLATTEPANTESKNETNANEVILNTQTENTETQQASNPENTNVEIATEETTSTATTTEASSNNTEAVNSQASENPSTELSTETTENTTTPTDAPAEQSISTSTETNAETVVSNTTEENSDQEQTNTVAPEATETQVFARPTNAPIDFTIIDSNLLAKQSDKAIWSLDFAKNSGETAANIIQQDNLVYIGHGNSLLRIDSKTGKILARWLLSGQIKDISENANTIAIDVEADGNSENFVLNGNNLDRAPVFSSDSNLYGWLENEANVANPAAKLAQDTTNPWLYLRAGQANPDSAEAKGLYNKAIDTAHSFYDAAGISQELLNSGQDALSTKAFSKALSDFAARGYDPRLLTNMKLHDSYNFPLEAFNSAIAKGDLAKAEVLAEQIKYFLSPNSPEIRASLVSYADLLKKNGNKDEANNWRKIAKSSNKTTVSNVLDKIFASLADVAWYAALATLLSTLALHLVLLFKYWRPQSVMLNRKREAGKKPSPIARLFAIRFYSTTEKLVLGLLLATTVLLAGLGTWNDKASNLPNAIGSGSYANASVQNFINKTNLSSAQGKFIKGYTAQAVGQNQEAKNYYQAAGNLPQALNNLAALNGDSNLISEALKYAKNMPEALYNSGKEVEGFDFQKDFLPGKPVLSVPTREDFQAALSGNWQDAIAKTFTTTYLLNANPFGLNPIIWKIILGLFAIYTVLSLLWILWPRPRMARNAPRSFLYNLLSFLVPGSGMADEMWGILLLLPWAIFGLDAISRFFGLGFEINGLSLRLDYFVLGAIYVINLIAIVVEFLSYRQRMNKLKEDDVDLAREFNLI